MSTLVKTNNVSTYVYLKNSQQNTQQNLNNVINHIPRLVNNLTSIVGNDIVLKGMDVSHSLDYDNQKLNIEIQPGIFIEDSTLLNHDKVDNISLDELQSLDSEGHIVVFIRYKYYQSNIQNIYLGVKYVNQQGQVLDGWDSNKDRLVLNIYSFTKDNTGKIDSVFEHSENYLNIFDKEYYKYGFHPENITLSRYIPYFLDGYTSNDLTIPSDDNSSNFDECVLNTCDAVDEVNSNTYGFKLQNGNIIFTDQESQTQLINYDVDENGCQYISIPDNTFASGDLNVNDKLTVSGNFVSHGENSEFDGNVVLNSDLLVRENVEFKGNSFFSDAVTTKLGSPFIELNKNEFGNGISTENKKSGLRVQRGTLGDALLYFNEISDKWEIKIGDQNPIELGTGSGSGSGGSSIDNIYHSDIVDWVSAFNESFNNKTTSDLSEGNNKYFTEQRAFDSIKKYIKAGENISLNEINNELFISSSIDPDYIPEHGHDIATTTNSGFLSSNDKEKLDNIEKNANNYQHPQYHSPLIINESDSKQFVSVDDKNLWNSFSKIFYGSTLPSDGIGDNGSYYIHSNGNIFYKSSGSWDLVSSPPSISPATENSLGSVIVGDNISVDSNGKISVSSIIENVDITLSNLENQSITTIKEGVNYLLSQPLSLSKYPKAPDQDILLGETLTNYELSWETNKPYESLTITLSNGNSYNVNSENRTFILPDLTESTSIQFEFVNGLETLEYNLDITFSNNIFFGSLNVYDYSQLNSIQSNNINQNFNINSNSGEYVFISVPNRLMPIRFFVSGLEGGIEQYQTYSITNSSGYTEEYIVFKSNNHSLGDLTVQMG